MEAWATFMEQSVRIPFYRSQFHDATSHCRQKELEELNNIHLYNPVTTTAFYSFYIASLICNEDITGALIVINRLPDKIAESDELKCLIAIVKLISRSEFTVNNMKSISVPPFIHENIIERLIFTWQCNERVRISKIYEEISVEEFADRMFIGFAEKITGLQSAESIAAEYGWRLEGGYLAPTPTSTGSKSLAGGHVLGVMMDLVTELDKPSLRFEHTPVIESETSAKDAKDA